MRLREKYEEKSHFTIKSDNKKLFFFFHHYTVRSIYMNSDMYMPVAAHETYNIYRIKCDYTFDIDENKIFFPRKQQTRFAFYFA